MAATGESFWSWKSPRPSKVHKHLCSCSGQNLSPWWVPRSCLVTMALEREGGHLEETLTGTGTTHWSALPSRMPRTKNPAPKYLGRHWYGNGNDPDRGEASLGLRRPHRRNTRPRQDGMHG